jgi:hypothetical protein
MPLTKSYLQPGLIKEFSSQVSVIDDILKNLLLLEWVVEPIVPEAFEASAKAAMALNFSSKLGFKQLVIRTALDILSSGTGAIKVLQAKDKPDTDRLFHLDNTCVERLDFNEAENFYIEWTSNVAGDVFMPEEMIFIPLYPGVPLNLQSSPLGLCLIAIAQNLSVKFIRGIPLDSPAWMDKGLKKERRDTNYELFSFTELVQVVSKEVSLRTDCMEPETFKQWIIHPGRNHSLDPVLKVDYQGWLCRQVKTCLHHLLVDFFPLPVDTEQALIIKAILWKESLDVQVAEIATCLAIAIHHQLNQFLSSYSCQFRITN